MKKLFILLMLAAFVGFVVSKKGGDAASDTSSDAASDPDVLEQATAQNTAPPRRPVNMRRTVRPAPPAPVVAVRDPEPEPPKAGSDTVSLSARMAALAGHTPRAIEPAPADAALAEAEELLAAGKDLAARALLSDLYLASGGETAARLRVVLDEINRELIFNPRCIRGAGVYTVRAGDSLWKIGKDQRVNWRMIQRVNRLEDPGQIGVNQQLKIFPGKFSTVAYKGEFRLALLYEGVYVKEYAIGIGVDDKTPTGLFTVSEIEEKPTWYKPGGGVIPYGDERNLLGERWIGFADEPGASGIGIHGTRDESSIGTKCSNGCLRMRNADVIELFDFMTVGSRAEIKE